MISGIVIINKEKGCTSNDVVRKTKKIFNNNKNKGKKKERFGKIQ